MALDRKSEASFSATPLYLCHGGSHTFTLKAEEHSPWVNQEFEEGGAVWTINCPPKGPDAPVEALQFWVQIEYTSPACKVDASLGHHRLVLDDVIGGEQFQVLEYGEQAELEVLESSNYTKGAAGVSALWKLGDREIKWAEPDADGWVRHTFIPPAAGVHALSVTVPSL
ncbi:hypothetical protein [Pseudomonas sp. O230]|uniref:hypothetical protein n=1 Tax=Pseudomonas sp. O230 TaxID=3159450 RepID=UPI00387A9B8A